MNKMYEVSNIRFYPVSGMHGNDTNFYLKGNVHGNVYPGDIWTKESILAEYPDAKEFKMAFGSNEFINH